MPRVAATPTTPYASQKTYRDNNPEKIKAINKRYYQKNKERLQAARRERWHSVEKHRSPREPESESADSPSSVTETPGANLGTMFEFFARTEANGKSSTYKKEFLKTKLQEILDSL